MRMTEEQRQLAKENHNLIYGFLRKKHLDLDEFYDICAIGLCKACAMYDGTRGALSTLAYHSMENSVKSYMRDKNRLCRFPESEIESLQRPVYIGKDDEKLYLEDVVKDEMAEWRYAYAAMDTRDYLDMLSDTEREVLILKDQGYTNKEIGQMYGKSHEWPNVIIRKAKRKYIEEWQ